jgi:hypothetical protein
MGKAILPKSPPVMAWCPEWVSQINPANGLKLPARLRRNRYGTLYLRLTNKSAGGKLDEFAPPAARTKPAFRATIQSTVSILLTNPTVL